MFIATLFIIISNQKQLKKSLTREQTKNCDLSHNGILQDNEIKTQTIIKYNMDKSHRRNTEEKKADKSKPLTLVLLSGD